MQRFIRGSIASAHTLQLTARDLKAIQVAQKGGMIKISECRELCWIKKETEDEQAQKRKDREEKRAEKQANSQLAQIEFLFGVPTVELVFYLQSKPSIKQF